MNEEQKESSIPHTGLFWYISRLFDGEWIIDFEHAYHEECWAALRQAGKVPDVDHTYFPRGRVIYKQATQTWVVVGDLDLVTNSVRRAEIKHAFSLASENVRFETSSAYISTYRADS